MIKYEGIKKINKVPYLCFSNEENAKIEIPIDIQTENRIIKYLSRISPPCPHLDRNNDLNEDE